MNCPGQSCVSFARVSRSALRLWLPSSSSRRMARWGYTFLRERPRSGRSPSSLSIEVRPLWRILMIKSPVQAKLLQKQDAPFDEIPGREEGAETGNLKLFTQIVADFPAPGPQN